MEFRVVSGGQTGVDRAALDVALALGLSLGGWVPKGRRAEDGPLSERYPVRETDSPHYADRTRRNVHDSDATLVITRGPVTGGTALTVKIAHDLGRPCLVVDLETGRDPGPVRTWLAETGPVTLNIAGPRESTVPGIYMAARSLLEKVFA